MALHNYNPQELWTVFYMVPVLHLSFLTDTTAVDVDSIKKIVFIHLIKHQFDPSMDLCYLVKPKLRRKRCFSQK